MGTALHIVLQGLIALTPSTPGPGGTSSMVALVVDARHLPSGVTADCFEPHEAMLTVSNVSSAECGDAGCKSTGNDCGCELERKQVEFFIVPSPQPTPQVLNQNPLTSALPSGSTDAVDFFYVANLSRTGLNMDLDPRFTEVIPPDALLARMTFPFDSVNACSLASTQDQNGDSVRPMSFRRLHALEQSSDLSQAVAQQLVAVVALPDNATVTLTISDFGEGHPFDLHPQPAAGLGYLITLSNMRPDLSPDAPCADTVGRDFAFFYELALHPPAWANRQIPHVMFTDAKSKKNLDNPGCLFNPTSNLSGRPICPMAAFNP